MTRTQHHELQDEALQRLRDDGPMTHDELRDALGMSNPTIGCDDDDVQQIIRILRHNGEAHLTLDRRYGAAPDD